ncbi:MAG TPA: carboxypeptidase-like regulatory domain-containing protein [Vicinamibacterales bacterium]|nr:carboxypeptidase-like regulatory domain-containing protein [Vicinamibacterales bacterium]
MARESRLSIAIVVVCAVGAACGKGPTGPSSTSERTTLAVEGTVRAIDGAPVPGALIVPDGVRPSAEHVFTDANGHYQLPSQTLFASSSVPTVSAFWPGYVSESELLPVAVTPGGYAHVDIRVQPRLELGLDAPLTITLTNDAITYGRDGIAGLPPRRWPVQVFILSAKPAGLTSVQAEWEGATPIRLWAERSEQNESREADPIGDGHGVFLVVPGAWFDDGVIFTVGRAAASGPLNAPVTIRLTVQPSIAATWSTMHVRGGSPDVDAHQRSPDARRAIHWQAPVTRSRGL